MMLSSSWHAGWQRILLGLSGLVPLLGLWSTPPDPMLLIYTIFVAAYLLRRQLVRRFEGVPAPSVILFVLFLISGTLTETLAWSNNYLKAAAAPALFHPQLLA